MTFDNKLFAWMMVSGKNDYVDGWNITQNISEEEEDGGREDGLDLSSRHILSQSLIVWNMYL